MKNIKDLIVHEKYPKKRKEKKLLIGQYKTVQRLA